MTSGDRTVLVAIVLLAALCIPLTSAIAGGGEFVELTGTGGSTRVDLSRDGTYVVEGHLGRVVFEVLDGQMQCVASSCPDQVCVHAGAVRGTRPVVCAPNGVVASLVTGPGERGYDAISR